MAPRRIEMLPSIIMSLMVVLYGATKTMGQFSTGCTFVILSLSPCLDYITGRASVPPSDCCSRLASVAGSQPQCLCEAISGDASSIAAGLNINRTLALELPSVCRVQTPPISSCSGSSFSPPATTGVSVSNIPYSPSGVGSSTVSSTTGGSGGGSLRWNSSSTKLPSSSLMLVFLLATTLTLTFMTTT